MTQVDTDAAAMQLAIQQAQLAAQAGEVPVGAVLVDADGQVIGRGYNQTIGLHDASAHAEIMALRDAGRRVGNYRFPGATLYVTLEPCVMCVGATIHARLARVVYGAPDPKTGACASVFQVGRLAPINHHTAFEGGVLPDECSEVLRTFFRERRQQHKARKAEGRTNMA